MAVMEGKLRVAIVGLGQIARLGHIPGYKRAGAEIVAGCDISEQSAKTACDAFGIPKWYSDWKEMIAKGGFDAVSVCVPSAFHCAVAVESALRGFHVLVEKPMATSLAECDQMIDAAKKGRVLLMISHNQRFMPAHVAAREIISSGELGAPYLVQTVFGHGGPERWSPTGQWYFDAKQARLGVMADLGYHKLDLVQWLLGQDIVGISALTGTYAKSTTLEDTVVGLLKFSGGAIGTMAASWAFAADMENSVVVRCGNGAVIVAGDDPRSLIVRKNLASGAKEEVIHEIDSTDPAGWFGSIGAFVESVSKGLPSPVTGEEGKKVMSVIFSAYESASSKRFHEIAG